MMFISGNLILWREVYMLVLCLSLIDDEYDRMNFERIYTKYADDVFKRICKLLKNKQDAEDVMQETWLTVAENIEFYRAKEEGSIRAYMLSTDTPSNCDMPYICSRLGERLPSCQ